VGQDVHAIGHPEGQIWTYTKGLISQIRANFEWSTSDRDKHRAKVIQTQTPINPGNSGGPLMDDNSRIIGINSFLLPGSQGLNYAVAVDEVREFLKRQTSRRAPSTQSGVAGAQLNCPEVYETKRQRRASIAGCYYGATSPPPHLWLVYQTPNKLDYGALGSENRNQLNTVMIGKSEKWETIYYLIDQDCNGTVDLIGTQNKGSENIDSYKRPKSPMRLDSWTTDLDYALKRGIIPYRGMRLCQ